MYPQVQIINAISRLTKGDIFELKKLLSNIWNNYTHAQKIEIGKKFKEEIDTGKHPAVKFKGKKTNNHAIYEKM